jgi:hypothetical protein
MLCEKSGDSCGIQRLRDSGFEMRSPDHDFLIVSNGSVLRAMFCALPGGCRVRFGVDSESLNAGKVDEGAG